MSLIPSLLGVTGLFVLLQAEFVAGIQILIYAGAIAVLILFVIMLTQGGTGTAVRQANEQRVVGALAAAALTAALLALLLRTAWPLAAGTLPRSNVSAVGSAFLTTFVLAFEISSVVLLVSLVGALVIARREQ
ncbi:MAG: NADH-quinone oxidoreductase subunit J, partial [Armatimonadota bacterium]|nr:NADH-quinone oxidoreductase subunit J [Armatimonadota bacterium]